MTKYRMSTVCPECEGQSTRHRVTTNDYICCCGWVGKTPKRALRCMRPTHSSASHRMGKIAVVYNNNPGITQKQLARECFETLYMIQKFMDERKQERMGLIPTRSIESAGLDGSCRIEQTDQAGAGSHPHSPPAPAPIPMNTKGMPQPRRAPSYSTHNHSHGSNELDRGAGSNESASSPLNG